MPTLKKITTHARLAAIAIVTLAALVIPALATSGMAYASITNTRVDPAGTLELASSSWLDGAGVDIYSNGNSAANEWGSNYVGSILSGTKWQCVEMVNRLYLTKGWTTGFWTGNGNSLVDHVPSGLTKQNNGAISYLDAGDVITLDDGGFGHAAIINSIGTSNERVGWLLGTGCCPSPDKHPAHRNCCYADQLPAYDRCCPACIHWHVGRQCHRHFVDRYGRTDQLDSGIITRCSCHVTQFTVCGRCYTCLRYYQFWQRRRYLLGWWSVIGSKATLVQ